MNLSFPLAAMVVLVLLVPRGKASEMRDELRVDASSLHLLRTRFATYGHRPRQTILVEADGLRFNLPSGGVPQTGVYSFFALAGDCEATITYDLLSLPPPQGGYGSGVGLAFDLPGGGRGAIQRLIRAREGSGCVVQTVPGEHGGESKEVDRFVPDASTRGRIGLRRVKNQLIFLSAANPDGPLEEIDRLPFPQGTIRALRVFADTGGSPTTLDVRVSNMAFRAEEIASGVPRSEQSRWGWGWLWTVVLAVSGVLLFWVWRTRRRNGETAR